MSKCSCQHKCLNASNQEQEEKAKETDSGYKKYGIKDQLRAEIQIHAAAKICTVELHQHEYNMLSIF